MTITSDSTYYVHCATCKGRGRVWAGVGTPNTSQRTYTCPHCNGFGDIVKDYIYTFDNGTTGATDYSSYTITSSAATSNGTK